MELRDLTQMREAASSARTWLDFARCKALAQFSDGQSALDLLEGMVGRDRAAPYRKSTIPALTGTATPELVEARLGAAFLDSFRSRRILPRLPGAVSVPPDIFVALAASEVAAGFVTEVSPIPVVPYTYDQAALNYGKLAIICAVTNELLKLTTGATFLDRQLTHSLSRGEDNVFLGSQAATQFGAPEGLLFGLSATGGGSPATLQADLYEVWSAVRDGDPLGPAWITSPRAAAYLASLHPDGVAEFPDISPATGGTLWGVSVLLSNSAGAKLILADGASVVFSDGGVTVDRSPQASIQMDTAPTPGATNLVSLFQAGATALRAIRYLTWAFGHTDRAAFLELPINGSPA